MKSECCNPFGKDGIHDVKNNLHPININKIIRINKRIVPIYKITETMIILLYKINYKLMCITC